MLVVDDDLHYCSRGLLGIRQDSAVTPGTGKSWNVDNLPRGAGRQVVVGAMVRVSLDAEREQESKCLIPTIMGKSLTQATRELPLSSDIITCNEWHHSKERPFRFCGCNS